MTSPTRCIKVLCCPRRDQK